MSELALFSKNENSLFVEKLEQGGKPALFVEGERVAPSFSFRSSSQRSAEARTQGFSPFYPRRSHSLLFRRVWGGGGWGGGGVGGGFGGGPGLRDDRSFSFRSGDGNWGGVWARPTSAWDRPRLFFLPQDELRACRGNVEYVLPLFKRDISPSPSP